MKNIAFIGDIEGEFTWYLSALDELGDMPSIQIGDMRMGFPQAFQVGTMPTMLPSHHMFIRGNHDKPLDCRNHPNYIGDYGYLHNFDIFYIGGAHSVDFKERKAGYNYWPDDEQIHPDVWGSNIISLYEKIRPRIVVSHDAPWSFVGSVVQNRKNDAFVGTQPIIYTENLTTTNLDKLFHLHKPDIWVFGHHHFDIQEKMGGTLFKCVPQRTVVELKDLYEKL